MNVHKQITVLHVDDDPQFGELTKTMLEREYDTFKVITETSPHKVTDLLEEHDVDCLVTDYDMPGMDGVELLEQIRKDNPTLPVILFTGKGTEAVASRAISAGVTEYLQKKAGSDHFAVLANRIRNAVEQRIHERKREQYRTVVETAGDAMYVLDEDGYIEIVNEAFEQMSGYDQDGLLGNHVSEFLSSTQAAKRTEAIQSLLRAENRDSERFRFRTRRPDGESRLYETTVSLVEENGIAGSVSVIRDITDDKRQEELLSGLFEESLHGIGVKRIVTDESGEPIDYVYKRVNDRFEELTGLNADEVVGNRATEVIDGIEDTPFIDIFGEVGLNGTTAQFEQYSAPLDRYYEVSAFSPRQGECISIFSDITERKKREQELKRYEKLIEYSPDLLVHLDEDMTVQYQNPPSPLFKWEPKDVVGTNPLDNIHPDDHEIVLEHFNELLQHPDRIVSTEFRAKDADGEWQWIESRGQNLTDDDAIDGILAVMRRVTDRKRQEQQLARYSDTLKQLQQTTQTLLEATDSDEAATHVIEAFESVLDFEIAGIWLSTPDRDALEPVAITEGGKDLIPEAPTYSAETQSLSWETYQEQELRYVRDVLAHEQRANPDTPIRSEVIVPLGQYGVLNIGSIDVDAFSAREIDLIKLWADTLTAAFARLTQIDLLQERESALRRERDRLDEFASVISHDLRNPLNVAMGRTELASEETDSDHLAIVTEALSRMEAMIDDLLLLARQGESIGEKEQIPLEDIISSCWQNVETANATLVRETTQTIRADRGRVSQLFENLFRNAVEHGGTDVTISVGELKNGFYIEDDGPGIAEEDRDSVFEAGYSTSEEGTGFGLSIVRQVAEAHGWTIRVTDGTEGGARFEITDVEFSTR